MSRKTSQRLRSVATRSTRKSRWLANDLPSSSDGPRLISTPVVREDNDGRQVIRVCALQVGDISRRIKDDGVCLGAYLLDLPELAVDLVDAVRVAD